MLSPEHQKLLCDMFANDGRVQMTSEADKERARHLIALGYAGYVLIDATSLAVEITAHGCAAKVLADFGIWNADFCAIEPQPTEVKDHWVIKVSTVGSSPILLEVTKTNELVGQLTEVGAIDIARRFQAEAERTRRYMKGLLRDKMQ
jgi:hypothetical protein